MRSRTLFVLVLLLVPAACARGDSVRPETWARPLQKPGLPNLFQVGDTLYRSAQPDAEGMRSAEALGIRTILNLRSAHGDADVAAGTRLRLVDLPMRAESVGEEDVAAALQVMVDPASQPVLVHCAHGADRTGAVVAAYRVVVQGWSKEDAVREMRDGGFGFHEVFINIPAFLRGLDVEKIRRQMGGPDRAAVPVAAPPAP